MKKLNQFTLVLSRVMEILCWIAVAAAAGLAVFSLFGKSWLEEQILHSMTISELDIGGLSLALIDGHPSAASVTFSALAGVALASLSAMIFRNIHLILRTAQGKTWFSKGDTPFQKDITRMIREIGIFLISTSAVNLIWSIGMRFILGADRVELGVELDSALVGMMVLCLSQFFDYGVQLQNDVDGLL